MDTIYAVGEQRIGYLCYSEYGDVGDLYAPLDCFKAADVTDLVLDLRYNPGGYVSTCKYLCNCIVPAAGYGAIFQQCAYNDVLTEYYLQKNGSGRSISYYEYPSSTDYETLGKGVVGLQLRRLFVLTSSRTASASEATIVCLRPYIEVVVIGDTTVGKGVGSWTISSHKYRYAIQPITMRYYNAIDESTPDTGIVPDYYIPDGYTTPKRSLGDVEEPLLRQALSLIAPERISQEPLTISTPSHVKENSLIPVGEPSYVIEFKNKHYNENF